MPKQTITQKDTSIWKDMTRLKRLLKKKEHFNNSDFIDVVI